MVEQRWLRTDEYPPCVIDEVTESFFAAPLLSIDEQVLRAFPVDPFDVARTRRRPTLSAAQADAMLQGPQAMPRFPLREAAPALQVKTQYTPPTPQARELAAPAVYAAPTFDSVAPPAPVAEEVAAAPLASAAVVPSAPASEPSLRQQTPAVRGWITGALIALAGLVVGSAFVCAALTRSEARVEPMPSVTAAISR